MLFYELVEGGAQAEACHKAGAAPVANGLLYSPEVAEAANGHGHGGGGVIGPNPGMYGPQMPSSSSVIGPAIGPQMPPGVAIGPQIGPQMPPLRPQTGAATAPAYRSLASGAEPESAGIIGPALPPAKQLSAHEAAAAELAAERAAEGGGWGGWSDAAAPSTPPQVGPQIGPQVGPQVGPQIGPHVGPQVGPHVGPQPAPLGAPATEAPALGQGRLPSRKRRWEALARDASDLLPPELRSSDEARALLAELAAQMYATLGGGGGAAAASSSAGEGAGCSGACVGECSGTCGGWRRTCVRRSRDLARESARDMGRLEALEHLEHDTVAAWPQTGALAARVGALVPMSSVVGELASKGCDMSEARRPPPAAPSARRSRRASAARRAASSWPAPPMKPRASPRRSWA